MSGSLDDLMEDLRGVRAPTAAEARDLARRRDAGDPSARVELARRNLFYGIRLARRCLPIAGQLELGDLVGCATVGLLEAAERFDPDRGRFTTCAAPLVRAAIFSGIAEGGHLVRVPKEILEAARGWRTTRAATRRGFAESVAAGRAAVGLAPAGRTPHGSDPEPIRALLAPGPSGPDPEDVALLHRAVAALPGDLPTLVCRHYGLGGADPVDLAAMAREIGVTRSCLSARAARARGLLREAMDRHRPFGARRDAS